MLRDTLVLLLVPFAHHQCMLGPRLRCFVLMIGFRSVPAYK